VVSLSILTELTTILAPVLPVEAGVFTSKPPDEYLVLTPLSDDFALHADNEPLQEISEVQISLFSKTNYQPRKKQITKLLLGGEFTITDRRYLGYETDSGYHHYCLDVAKEYEM